MSVIQFILDHLPQLVSAIIALCSALIGIFVLIPGDQPEKALQGVVDFIKKFSAK